MSFVPPSTYWRQHQLLHTVPQILPLTQVQVGSMSTWHSHGRCTWHQTRAPIWKKHCISFQVRFFANMQHHLDHIQPLRHINQTPHMDFCRIKLNQASSRPTPSSLQPSQPLTLALQHNLHHRTVLFFNSRICAVLGGHHYKREAALGVNQVAVARGIQMESASRGTQTRHLSFQSHRL